MKQRCSKCELTKKAYEFYRDARGTSLGLSYWCKECRKSHQTRYHRRHRKRLNRKLKKYIRRLRRLRFKKLAKYFSRHPCVDCGETDILVLEFDHIGKKRAGIGVLMASLHSWRQIRKEIRKCEVVCANCHRIRTGNRAGWFRTKAKAFWTRKQRRLIRYLKRHPCKDCGEADVRVLEFDHVRGVKTAAVANLVKASYSWRRIHEEIRKCEVVCANCHRRRTYSRKLCWRSERVLSRQCRGQEAC